MGVSFSPEVWEKLSDLRERHQRLVREAADLRRFAAEGEATREDCERAEAREWDAWLRWRRIHVGPLGQHTVTPDEEIEQVPRDH